MHKPRVSYAVFVFWYSYDGKAFLWNLTQKMWNTFKDSVFVAWTHDTAMLPYFSDYLNYIDGTGIKFTMQVADKEMD